MKTVTTHKGMTRRDFFQRLAGGVFVPYLSSLPRLAENPSILNDVFWVKNIPDFPFYNQEKGNWHLGLDSLLFLMAGQGLRFYRSTAVHPLAGPAGLIAAEDVVLIKVNAQWKYRGCTNSDLIRGLVQRILDHPDGFTGEVVIFENGQGRGSLNCDTSSSYGDTALRANANDESHSFLFLVDRLFRDPRVSAFLLDPIRRTFIGAGDHFTDGYRVYENVSYPCFTTAGGRRIELREGIWQGDGYSQNLKLINVPVLKHHDVGGSEITISLKHFYGVVSMADGQSAFRHYSGLGETCGKMMAFVCTPVLNIVDAIWVSHSSLKGYPVGTTFRANQLLASQDPVAADAWAAEHILYPIDGNFRHHPAFSGVDRWLSQARDLINRRGGLYLPEKGIQVGLVTNRKEEMNVHRCDASEFIRNAVLYLSAEKLQFVVAASGAGVMEQSFFLSNSGSGSFSWRIDKDAHWLTCSPSAGNGSMNVVVRVDPSDLEVGRYTGRIFIHCSEAANSPQVVLVNMILLDARERGRPRNSKVEGGI